MARPVNQKANSGKTLVGAQPEHVDLAGEAGSLMLGWKGCLGRWSLPPPSLWKLNAMGHGLVSHKPVYLTREDLKTSEMDSLRITTNF